MSEITATAKTAWSLIGVTEDDLATEMRATMSSALRSVDRTLYLAVANIESAEREVRRNLHDLTNEAARSATALDAGNRFDGNWLTNYAQHAAEAGSKIQQAFDQISEFAALRKEILAEQAVAVQS